MTKEDVLSRMDDFKNEYGTSFASAEPDACAIIEKALDLYYSKDAKKTFRQSFRQYYNELADAGTDELELE